MNPLHLHVSYIITLIHDNHLLSFVCKNQELNYESSMNCDRPRSLLPTLQNMTLGHQILVMIDYDMIDQDLSLRLQF